MRARSSLVLALVATASLVVWFVAWLQTDQACTDQTACSGSQDQFVHYGSYAWILFIACILFGLALALNIRFKKEKSNL